MLQNAVFCDDIQKKPSALPPDPYQGLCPWTPLGAYCGPQTPASFSSFFTFPQSHVCVGVPLSVLSLCMGNEEYWCTGPFLSAITV